MDAVYISSNSFSVSGDRTLEFVHYRRVKLTSTVSGTDVIYYTGVLSSVYSDPNTVVVIDESILTSDLNSVLYGIVEPGLNGSLPNHDHSCTEGMGGGGVSLIYLTDTPSIYDDGKYLKSTVSGTEWATTSVSSSTLLDLTDTPSTYSGTENAMLISTGSGTEFTQEGRWLGGQTIPLSVGKVGNYYLAETSEEIYKKNRQSVAYFEARSVILDIADNHGATFYIGIRSIEFKLNGVLLDVEGTLDADAYATTQFSSSYLPIFTFDVSLSKTDNRSGNAWISSNSHDTNQRLICVFASAQMFNEIVVNNGYDGTAVFDEGAKNTKIHISTDVITSTVYDQAIANSTLIFDDIIAIHIDSDVIDDQVLDIDDALDDLGADTGWDKVLSVSKNFLTLDDTPLTYSGTEGQYLISTGSGTEWSDVSSGSNTFSDLTDTPSTYDDGKYLKSTVSGTEWVDPIVTTVTGTILYGTGAPPDPAGYADGTLFFKYVN